MAGSEDPSLPRRTPKTPRDHARVSRGSQEGAQSELAFLREAFVLRSSEMNATLRRSSMSTSMRERKAMSASVSAFGSLYASVDWDVRRRKLPRHGD